MASTSGIEVAAYAGYKGEEAPRRFTLGGGTVEVAGVLDQWREPDHVYFKVLGHDGGTYVLRYDMKAQRWELGDGVAVR